MEHDFLGFLICQKQSLKSLFLLPFISTYIVHVLAPKVSEYTCTLLSCFTCVLCKSVDNCLVKLCFPKYVWVLCWTDCWCTCFIFSALTKLFFKVCSVLDLQSTHIHLQHLIGHIERKTAATKSLVEQMMWLQLDRTIMTLVN